VTECNEHRCGAGCVYSETPDVDPQTTPRLRANNQRENIGEDFKEMGQTTGSELRGAMTQTFYRLFGYALLDNGIDDRKTVVHNYSSSSPSSYASCLLTYQRRRTGKSYEIGRSRYFEHAGNAPKLIHDSDAGSTHADFKTVSISSGSQSPSIPRISL
ncbi:hypothetical protein ALC60_09774, partial [Trachymyrmex zeteki]